MVEEIELPRDDTHPGSLDHEEAEKTTNEVAVDMHFLMEAYEKAHYQET